MHGIHLMVINISKVFLDEETIDCSISARFTLEKLLPLWLIALTSCSLMNGAKVSVTSWLRAELLSQNCDGYGWLTLNIQSYISFIGFMFSKSWEAETRISHYLLKLSCWVWISFCPLDTFMLLKTNTQVISLLPFKLFIETGGTQLL